MIKYYKFGLESFRYCNEEIRLERLTREAKILIEKYDDTCDEKYIKSFCEYIDLSVDEFWDHVRASVNTAELKKMEILSLSSKLAWG